MTTQYYLKLAQFEGPLDLLLHLIKKGPFAEQEAFGPRPETPAAPLPGMRTAPV